MNIHDTCGEPMLKNPLLDIGDGNRVVSRADRGQHGVPLLDLIDRNIGGTNGGAVRRCRLSVGESDSAEVGKREQVVVLRVVLNNPLGVLLTKSRRGIEGLRDGLPIGGVLDDNCASRVAGGIDRESDDVAGAERDIDEVVVKVGVPFVPG